MKICLFFQDFRARTSKRVRTAMKYRQQRGSRSSCSEKKSQQCLRLTPNNAKTIERMTCHCFLRPITRDIPRSSYTGHGFGGPFLHLCYYTHLSAIKRGGRGDELPHSSSMQGRVWAKASAVAAPRISDFKRVFKDRCSIKLAKETHSHGPILQQTNNQHGQSNTNFFYDFCQHNQIQFYLPRVQTISSISSYGIHSIREQTKGLNVHCLYSINNFPFLCLTLRGFLHQSPLLK